jgi:HAD superfamily hydrolase (TIGR01509 family)
MPRPDACLFDLDGLLLDTEPLHGEAWQQAAHHFGVDLAAQELIQLRGRRRLDCAIQVRRWIEGKGGTPPSNEELLAVRQPIAEALLPLALPMPGAMALIETCRRLAIPMAMVTSSSRTAVALKEAPHPWLAAIRLRVHGDDPELHAGKPAPDPYLLAARRLAVDPRRCWAFEDSPAGAQAAAAAGCQVHVLLPTDGIDGGVIREGVPPGCVILESLAQVTIA